MKSIFMSLVLWSLAACRRLIERSPLAMNILFIPGFERLRWKIGEWKAMHEHRKARREVPAYRDFIQREVRHRLAPSTSRGLSAVPVIDKFNYVRKYAPAECCRGGVIPSRGVMVDESSGSTGTATNWVRSQAERISNKRVLEFALSKLIGDGPRFVINAFALGPWATGVNVSMAFTDSSILKSLGPDAPKIENTLSFFGSAYKYVILGYPPFLKTLADTANIDWNAFDVTFIFGGESMSEAMRSYLLTRGIRRVYGSYGASDLELNIASENDFTINFRRLLEKNKPLADRIVRYAGATPMIFQYNPLDFFIESSEEGELLVSLCRPAYVMPKVRYNIHDRGHVVRMPALKKILDEFGIDILSIGNPASDLPLLFHYGRADMTVPFYGSKISPADLQESLFRVPGLASRIGSYTMVTYENSQADRRLAFSLECLPGVVPSQIADGYQGRKLLEELMVVNHDFRDAMRIAGTRVKPDVEFHAYRTGPFLNNGLRIKQNYITRMTDQTVRIASAI